MDALLPLSSLKSFFNSLLGALIGLTVAYLIKFYNDVRKYPPGPLPIPLIGNLLLFARKGDRPPHKVILDLKEKYGSVYTFWMGYDPQVIIVDPKLAKEAMISYHFGGRPSFGSTLSELFFPDGCKDIILADWGREWEILRRVAHSAIRKFAVNENLPRMVHECLRQFFKEIDSKDGDKPFDPEVYTSFLMLSLITTINFDEYLTMDHPDYIAQNGAIQTQIECSNTMFLVDTLPPLKYVWSKDWQRLLKSIDTQFAYLKGQLARHQKTYQDGTIRDFTDAMICAQREAEAENSPDLAYLKEGNILQAIGDIYAAGSETTKLTLLWTFLYLAKYPDHQKAIREEVESVVGDSEYPLHEHRADCHLLQAFVSEVMRIRPIVPTNVPHKAIVDSQIGGLPIKKGTTLLIAIEPLLMDPEAWDEPEQFRPERFLHEDGKYNSKPNGSFLPFGAGRRVCLGEKLANANVFLLLAGILHQTKGKMITVPSGVDLGYKGDSDTNGRPRPYQIKLVEASE